MERYESVTAGTGCERVRTVAPELLVQELRSGKACTVVDVRSSEDFHTSRGHLPRARSIPLAELPTRHEELECHRSEPVVVVSRDGRRARLAVLELELVGFTEVRALEGGMDRWWALDLPLEREPTSK